jgi:NADH dehydrogenase/NADH:ubiquinone oxidoreductase subunit G
MSNKITLTVNGKEISVNPGVTVYWAAKKLGIEIPHLCYGEDLPPMSACRICVVEVEGMRNLAVSCSHPVSEGMVVHTDTERVRRAQRMNLELLLSDHNVECITCEKSGECLLEKYAYEFGIKEPSFPGARNEHVIRQDDPFIVRDYNKCILCGRCVYVCSEIQYDSAIGIAERGFPARVSTSFEKPLQETT